MGGEFNGEGCAAAEGETLQKRETQRHGRLRLDIDARQHLLQKAVAVAALDDKAQRADLSLHANIEPLP